MFWDFKRMLVCALVLCVAACSTTAQDRTPEPSGSEATAKSLEASAAELRKSNSPASREAAIAAYQEALAHWVQIGDRQSQARVLNTLGQLYDYSGKHIDALRAFEKALDAAGPGGDPKARAASFYGVGKIRAAAHETPKALDAFREALLLREQTGELFEQALILHNMAAAQWAVAENERALENYRRALDIRREIEDRPGLGYTYFGIAITHWSSGDRQFALDACRESLRIWEQLKNDFGRANVRNSMGLLYAELGDYVRAREAYQEALSLWAKVKNPVMAAYTRNNIGMAEAAAGNYAGASRFYRLALPVLQEAKDERGVAYVFHNQGDLALLRNSPLDALPAFEESLARKRKIGDRFGEAITLERIAEARRLAGQLDAAAAGFEDALKRHRETGNKSGETMALRGLARVLLMQGDSVRAVNLYRDAIRLTEAARGAISNEDLRVSYFTTAQELYGEAIRALSAQAKKSGEPAWLEEAFILSERGRARALLEALADAPPVKGRSAPGAISKPLETGGRLTARMRAVSQRIQRLASFPGNEQELARARTQLDDLVREWQDQIAAGTNPGDSAGGHIWPRGDVLRQIRDRLLDTETELLAFRLDQNESVVWRVSPDAIEMETLPGRKTLERYARLYLGALTARAQAPGDEDLIARQLRLDDTDEELEPAARELSWLLFSGILKGCTAQRLVVIPDGILHAVPFAALPQPYNPVEPLLARWEIARAPSASVLTLIREQHREPAANHVAVVADPVYNPGDTRLRGKPLALAADLLTSTEWKIPGFQLPATPLPRLRFTGDEAKAIEELSPLPVSTYTGFEASRSLFNLPEVRHAQVLHLGTHAWVDDDTPLASGVAFSLFDRDGNPQDGYLRLFDIYQLRLRAELVVLGGCRTALGKHWAGEGVEGLARGFLHAGVPKVVASLWRVDDAASAELMRAFYQDYLGKNIPAAQALRRAQLGLARNPRFHHPYYWGSYVLEGDWR